MIKIKVPQKITILSHTYRIVYNPNLWRDEKYGGVINHRTEEIQIEPAIALGEKDVTLLHEIIEGIKAKFECSVNHEDIERIAQGVVAFLKNDLGIEFDWSSIKEIK